MKLIFCISFIAGWFYGTTFAISKTHENEKTKISIFMASDNDLYPYAKKDLKEISNYFLSNENNLYLKLGFDRQNKSYITTNTSMDHLKLKVIPKRRKYQRSIIKCP